jgi:hypothetical protein
MLFPFIPPVMSSDYPFGDNAVRPSHLLCLLITLLVIMLSVHPLLCLLFTLLAIMLSVLPPVMASDYPFGDNAFRPSPCYVF